MGTTYKHLSCEERTMDLAKKLGQRSIPTRNLLERSFMNLTFLCAASTVTGSKPLLTREAKRLLVDCGLFQGYQNLRLLNWEPFPFDPKQFDAVMPTHAHRDHSGAGPLGDPLVALRDGLTS